MSRKLTLRDAATGASGQFEEDNLIFVENDTLGAQIEYVKEDDGKRRRLIVSNTRPQIQSMSTVIIPLTFNGSTAAINLNRINEVIETSTGCNVMYDVEGTVNKVLESTETYQTVMTRVYEKQGETVYTFDAVNATNNTISLASSFGNLTSTFAATKVFQVFGSGDEDFDGMYTVSSSTYAGGKTVITVQQDIPSGVATSGSILLGAVS